MDKPKGAGRLFSRPEILAPAGGMEAAVAAAECGAGAVYVGGKAFSARGNAENFDVPALAALCDFCHVRGMRVYQAVNTLVFDGEYPALRTAARDAAQAGVDALIVQDIGVAAFLAEALPGMPLHASTQMSLHSPLGAAAAEAMGFSRVVAARELSETELRAFIAETPLEVEVFVHGALCMSVSGQCYMSAMLGGRSGNGGLCAQPCRLPYGGEYPLSLKDMTLVPRLRELADMGVTSFKIEGRMKRPEYVAAAVTACRAALDGGEPDMDTLRAVFSRGGFTDGYYAGTRTRAMFGVRGKDDVTAAADVLPALRRLYAAPYKRATLDFALALRLGEPAVLTASDAASGLAVTAEGDVPQPARTRPTDGEQARRQLGKLGDTIYDIGAVTVDADGPLMLPAAALNALRRDVCSSMDAARGRVAPAAQAGGARARAGHAGGPSPRPPLGEDGCRVDALRVHPAMARVAGQALKLRYDFSEFTQLADIGLSALEQFSLPVGEAAAHVDALLPHAGRLILSPPRVLFGEAEERCAQTLESLRDVGFMHMYCHTLGHAALARRLGMTGHGGFGLNAVSAASVRVLAGMGLADATLSFECRLQQALAAAAASPIPAGIVAYGRLPLMLMRCCPLGGAKDCARCPHVLADRTGRVLPILCGGQPDAHGAQVLNADVLFLADRLPELAGFDFLSLSFTTESPAECARVYAAYARARAGQAEGLSPRPPLGEAEYHNDTLSVKDAAANAAGGAHAVHALRHTRGLYYRGVL